jgi:hypothetical protein
MRVMRRLWVLADASGVPVWMLVAGTVIGVAMVAVIVVSVCRGPAQPVPLPTLGHHG